jgi:hypothetical protein
MDEQMCIISASTPMSIWHPTARVFFSLTRKMDEIEPE